MVKINGESSHDRVQGKPIQAPIGKHQRRGQDQD